MHSVSVRHNFETGHRLPHLGGKCQNLHGHSWWATITVSSDQLTRYGTVVEYGALKRSLRAWIDEHLDHGLMLGKADPLAALLSPHGKVFEFDTGLPMTNGLDWPTVENVAELLGRVTSYLLVELPPEQVAASAHCSRVVVSETHVNTATWSAS